jgi:hypothetical protein
MNANILSICGSTNRFFDVSIAGAQSQSLDISVNASTSSRSKVLGTFTVGPCPTPTPTATPTETPSTPNGHDAYPMGPEGRWPVPPSGKSP